MSQSNRQQYLTRAELQPLTPEQAARLTPIAVQAWGLLCAGRTRQQAGRALGVTPRHMSDYVYRVRRVLAGGTQWDAKHPTFQAREEAFEAMCERETANELAHPERYRYMRPEDWQPCAACGLRGHQVDACDLTELREAIAERRTYHDLGGEL